MSESVDKRELERELSELRAENEKLRSRLRVDPAPVVSSTSPEDARPVRVLLLPDPLAPAKPGGPGPKPIANMAEVLIGILRRRRPEIDWRAEFDLKRIPAGAECHRLGEALRTMWSGGEPPATFAVEEDGESHRLRRRLVDGEPASEAFKAGYDALLGEVTDVLNEGAAAHDAGAGHHATWALKAADVLLARLNLARVMFTDGSEDWRSVLAEARPEYEPAGAFA